MEKFRDRGWLERKAHLEDIQDPIIKVLDPKFAQASERGGTLPTGPGTSPESGWADVAGNHARFIAEGGPGKVRPSS